MKPLEIPRIRPEEVPRQVLGARTLDPQFHFLNIQSPPKNVLIHKASGLETIGGKEDPLVHPYPLLAVKKGGGNATSVNVPHWFHLLSCVPLAGTRI